VKSLTFAPNILTGLKDEEGQMTLNGKILSALTALNSLISQQQTFTDNGISVSLIF
jgi:hypothetical protein